VRPCRDPASASPYQGEETHTHTQTTSDGSNLSLLIERNIYHTQFANIFVVSQSPPITHYPPRLTPAPPLTNHTHTPPLTHCHHHPNQHPGSCTRTQKNTHSWTWSMCLVGTAGMLPVGAWPWRGRFGGSETLETGRWM
jgi:hypothetical protein